MALNANALITVAELETMLQITFTDTAYAEMLINTASAAIEKYCERRFIKATYTEEIYDGNSARVLYLKNAPVTAGSVTVKDWDTYNNTEDYTYTEHEDYLMYYDEGYIYKRWGWAKIHQFYRVTYEAGFDIADVPYDLKIACAKTSEMIKNQTGKAGAGSETMGRYSIDYSGTSEISDTITSPAAKAGLPFPPSVAGVLDTYKRYRHYEL